MLASIILMLRSEVNIDIGIYWWLLENVMLVFCGYPLFHVEATSCSLFSFFLESLIGKYNNDSYESTFLLQKQVPFSCGFYVFPSPFPGELFPTIMCTDPIGTCLD